MMLILYFPIAKSFIELLRYIFKIPGVKFFLSERLSQDPLENFFGCQRQRCRTNENPNLNEFCKNTQALRVINSVCGTVSKGNCRGNKQGVDMDENNKPLPKRRRVRKQKRKSSHPITSITSVPSHPVTTSVTSVPSHPVTTSVISVPSHSVTTSVTSVPSHPVTTSVTSVPSHSVTTSVTSVPSHLVTTSLTFVPSHLGKPITCQDNLNGIDSVTALSVPSASADDMDFLSDSSDDDLKSETESESGLWDDLDDSLTTKPLNPLCSGAVQPTWLQHNSVHKGIIDKLLGPGAANEELCRGFGIVLRRQDFWTLKDSEWLNDQVSQLSLTP